MVALALALIQADPGFLDRHRVTVLFTEFGPRIMERCEAEGLYRYEPDSLLEFLDHADPTIRRNAACELASLGRREGIDALTVEPDEHWTRRYRIASALFDLDRERGAALLRPMLDDPHALARAAAVEKLADTDAAERLRGDPSETVRRAAARVLGLVQPDPAPEPRLTEEEWAAVGSLASDAAAVRDAASATLASASESAISILAVERDRAADAEVRLRLARAIRDIQDLARPPVGLVRNGGRFALTNNSAQPVTVYVHPDGAIPTHFWQRRPEGHWLVSVPGDCELTHESLVLAPDASYEFAVAEAHLGSGTYRIEFIVRVDGSRIKVVSEPFSK